MIVQIEGGGGGQCDAAKALTNFLKGMAHENRELKEENRRLKASLRGAPTSRYRRDIDELFARVESLEASGGGGSANGGEGLEALNVKVDRLARSVLLLREQLGRTS